MSNAKKDNDAKFSVKWVIYVVLSFIGNGACTVVQRLQQLKYGGLYKNEFMIIALSTLVIVLTIAALIKERGEIKNCLKPTVFSVTNGLANGLTNLLVMRKQKAFSCLLSVQSDSILN
jgi:nucleoside recognition membrane protein YjiH